MPRRSSGGRSAPAAVPLATVRSPPQQASPAPAPAPSHGGSVLGKIGSMVAEGLAWGTGSSTAHRAVDAVIRPSAPAVAVHVDTINGVLVNGTLVPSAPPVAAALMSDPVGSDVCNTQCKAFQDCINNDGSDISKCQFYIDMLNKCRRGSGTVIHVE